MNNPAKAITLVELLIALALFSVLILGFASLDKFCRYHLITSEAHVTIQNELSYVLEDMAKNIVRSTGNRDNPGIRADIAGGFRVRVDENIPATPLNYGDDIWVEYTISGYRIAKNGVLMNKRNVILPLSDGGFNWQIIDNGAGVTVSLKGRYDPSSAVSSVNPQTELKMTGYSRSASAG